MNYITDGGTIPCLTFWIIRGNHGTVLVQVGAMMLETS